MPLSYLKEGVGEEVVAAEEHHLRTRLDLEEGEGVVLHLKSKQNSSVVALYIKVTYYLMRVEVVVHQ